MKINGEMERKKYKSVQIITIKLKNIYIYIYIEQWI